MSRPKKVELRKLAQARNGLTSTASQTNSEGISRIAPSPCENIRPSTKVAILKIINSDLNK